MPETRLAKTRRSLPEGYQFGDASVCGLCERPRRVCVADHCVPRQWFNECFRMTSDERGWGVPPEARLEQQWNVIEGEHFTEIESIRDDYGPLQCSVLDEAVPGWDARDAERAVIKRVIGETYTTDRDPGDETPTRRLRRREA